MTTSVEHKPKEGTGTWEFDKEVAVVFDDMLDKSVPLYKQAHELTRYLSTRFVPDGGKVLDLGVSTAFSFDNLKELRGRNVDFIGVDESPSMLVEAKNKFPDATYYNSHIQEFCNVPFYPHHNISLDGLNLSIDMTLLYLTLQFTPIEHRSHILEKVYHHTVKGGAVFLFEKCLGKDSFNEGFYTDVYYNFKSGSGYSDDNILAKRKSLENVLVPMPPEYNQSLLENAGFRSVELLSWCNFVLWVGIK